jgi:hypothetical protein
MFPPLALLAERVRQISAATWASAFYFIFSNAFFF